MRSRRHRRGLHKAVLTPSLHGSHTSSWYMALQNSSMRPLHDRLVTHCSGTCSGGIPSRIQASPHEGSSNVFVGASSTDQISTAKAKCSRASGDGFGMSGCWVVAFLGGLSLQQFGALLSLKYRDPESLSRNMWLEAPEADFICATPVSSSKPKNLYNPSTVSTQTESGWEVPFFSKLSWLILPLRREKFVNLCPCNL